MRCEDLEHVVADHLAERLSAEAAADLAGHLRGCESCRQEMRAFERTWADLGRLPAEPVDLGPMRARFQAALDEAMRGARREAGGAHTGDVVPVPALAPLPATDDDGVTSRRPASSAVARRWLALAAVLLAGIFIGRETAREPAVGPEIAQLREELRAMREMVGLSLLQQASASERLKGVRWAARLDQPGDAVTHALLDALANDPNVNVRLAAIDALARFAGHDEVRQGVIEALPNQTSPLVQVALVDVVGSLHDSRATDALRRLAAEPVLDADVRTHVEQVLAKAS